MTTGFIIGKFYPFHLGHMFLVDVARVHCDHLIIWVCERADQTVLGHVRAGWIKELYPNVEVRLVPDTLPDDDTAGWAKYTLRVLGKAPDIVFTSEDYGKPYATAMGSKHMLVDIARVRIPISGTKVRCDTIANWEYLAPPVRAYFTKRIAIIGAESTGKTTLAADLAAHYKTTWVPEYGREYFLRRKIVDSSEWSTNEFVHIASEQARREDEKARYAHGLLFCDTDPFTTGIWHKRYLGRTSPLVSQIGDRRKYELTIVAGDEMPFTQDGTRDGEHIRHDMQEWLQNGLDELGREYVLVVGSREERLQAAIVAIDSMPA